MTQQDEEFEQLASLAEDDLLRNRGHPQQHIYAFRSAGLTYDTMTHLPLPWYDYRGIVHDEYWQTLQEYGVPTAAFPASASQHTARNHTAREQELRSFASQVTRFSASPAHQPSGPMSTATAAHPASFEARFGSPVRRINFAAPPTPATPGSSSLGTASLMSIARRAAPGSSLPSAPSPASGVGSTPNQPPSDTSFCDHIDFVVDPTSWQRIRSGLVSSSQCLVLSAFALTDKQFQSALPASRVPESIRSVGTKDFDLDAWRDLKEWFEALDVWNLYCALHCTTFRAILDNHESISMGGNEMARALRQVPTFKFLGHSELTTGLTQWHAQHVLGTPTLLFASLASVVLRDRAIRPLVLAKINPAAKQYIRSTFVHDTGFFATHIAALHSWRFKTEDVWSALFELNKSLASKKPAAMPIRDWHLRLDRWRVQRRALAKTDIDSDNDHIWMMRCLESLSGEAWYRQFRKTMASDERNGIFITSVDMMWDKVEDEETWLENMSRSHVNAISDATDFARKRTREDGSSERLNRFARDSSSPAAGAGRGRGRGLGRGRNDERDVRRPGATRPQDALPGDADARPGARKWGLFGFAEDHPNPAPNSYEWTCRTCKQNPCRGFCKVCLQTCAHQADHSNKSECPYYNGTRPIRAWDFTRPCIKCRTPRADHQPWKCPSDQAVRIYNRQYPPRIMVEYPKGNRSSRRVMHIAPLEEDEEYDPTYPDDYEEQDDNEAICAHIASFVGESDFSADASTPAEDAGSLPNESDVQHACVTTSDDKLGTSIKEAIDKFYEDRNPRVNAVTYYVSFVDRRGDLLGAVLLDTGAQINIENDITCFVGYLEPSSVRIGLAEKNSQLRNCGYGSRERRYRDNDGQVYVVRDNAYYCPDAAYPIMSSGSWEERDASVLLNPGKRFRRTESGKQLPQDSASALIIDKNERILVLRQVPGFRHLHWLFQIKATTVEDVERDNIVRANKKYVSSISQLQDQLDEAADAPTVREYASKVKDIERQIEEAHLLHSTIYGASQQEQKDLLLSAHSSILELDHARDRSCFDDVDANNRKRAYDETADVSIVCSNCRSETCSADTCIFPCNMCEMSTGHASDCPVAQVQRPPRTRIHGAGATSSSSSSLHTIVPDREPNRIPDPSRDVQPVQLDTGAIGKTCASLEIVRNAIETHKTNNPEADVSSTVVDVITDIAASVSPMTWHDTQQSVRQAVSRHLSHTVPVPPQEAPAPDGSSASHMSPERNDRVQSITGAGAATIDPSTSSAAIDKPCTSGSPTISISSDNASEALDSSLTHSNVVLSPASSSEPHRLRAPSAPDAPSADSSTASSTDMQQGMLWAESASRLCHLPKGVCTSPHTISPAQPHRLHTGTFGFEPHRPYNPLGMPGL